MSDKELDLTLDEEAEFETPSKAIEAPEAVRCERCGHMVGTEVGVEPTEEDRAAYTEAMLMGDKDYRFTKTLTAIGGRFEVTFRDLLLTEEQQISDEMTRLLLAREIVTSEQILFMTAQLRMLFAIERISRDGRIEPLPPMGRRVEDGESLKAATLRIFDYGAHVTSLLHRLLTQFLDLCAVLDRDAPDDDF